MNDKDINKLKDKVKELEIQLDEQQTFCNWVFVIFNTICVVLSVIIIFQFV